MSTISVRITLLMLATSMFAVVWSNDHKPRPVHPRTVVPYDFSTLCPEEALETVSLEIVHELPPTEFVAEAAWFDDVATVEVESPVLKPLVADKPAVIRVSELEFPLPSDLRTGEYRVIDRFGNIESLCVTTEKLISWGMTAEASDRNAYEVGRGENRWHFIRIEEPVQPAPTQKEVAAAWNSVFHFAGRKASPTIKKASAPLSRWLGGELNLTGETREVR